uniref:Uncharacterized protein n=1 Tax=Lepeophtheirus salmonis TaxID=72036 RepID=A0A0K2TJU7_LEPSM
MVQTISEKFLRYIMIQVSIRYVIRESMVLKFYNWRGQ